MSHINVNLLLVVESNSDPLNEDAFAGLPLADVKLDRSRTVGISGTEMVVHIAIAVVGAFTYESLRVFVEALRDRIRAKLSPSSSNTAPVITFQGVKYVISNESDINVLISDLKKSVGIAENE
jgi:hypothetical protein